MPGTLQPLSQCVSSLPLERVSPRSPQGMVRGDPGNEVSFFSSPYKPTDILYPGYNYIHVTHVDWGQN